MCVCFLLTFHTQYSKLLVGFPNSYLCISALLIICYIHYLKRLVAILQQGLKHFKETYVTG